MSRGQGRRGRPAGCHRRPPNRSPRFSSRTSCGTARDGWAAARGARRPRVQPAPGGTRRPSPREELAASGRPGTSWARGTPSQVSGRARPEGPAAGLPRKASWPSSGCSAAAGSRGRRPRRLLLGLLGGEEPGAPASRAAGLKSELDSQALPPRSGAPRPSQPGDRATLHPPSLTSQPLTYIAGINLFIFVNQVLSSKTSRLLSSLS